MNHRTTQPMRERVNLPLPADSTAIVIPVRDGLPFFKLAFHSILSFTDRPARIFIVDCGSQDVARKFFQACKVNHGATVVQYHGDFNLAAAYNLGFRVAFKDPAFAFGVALHADVVAGPGWLERLVAGILHGPSVAWAIQTKRGGIPSPTPCLAFRRSLYERLGGFDEGYKGTLHVIPDFQSRAVDAGFQGWQDGHELFHYGRTFFNGPDREAAERADAEKYWTRKTGGEHAAKVG